MATWNAHRSKADEVLKRIKNMDKNKERNNHWLERIAKGFAHSSRIQVLSLLNTDPELSLDQISRKLKINVKTLSGHIYRMLVTGLVWKQKRGSLVLHRLSSRGEVVWTFLKKLK